jgi:dolichol-phosphate mannosyltransferase
MRTLVIVPTYQEAPNIPDLLPRVREAAPTVDLLIVDDSSPDGTAEVARSLGKEHGHVEVVVRPRKEGLGAAYRHGFAIGVAGGYEVLVQMDADLSHDPATIPALVGALEAGADLAIGSRYVPGGQIPHWPWYRRAMSRYGNLYTRVALGLKTRDLTSGFRAWRASTLRAIDVGSTTANGYLFQIEIARRVHEVGLSTVEIPITFTDRVRGQSKMNSSVIFEELTHVTAWGLRDGWRQVTGRKRTTLGDASSGL